MPRMEFAPEMMVSLDVKRGSEGWVGGTCDDDDLAGDSRGVGFRGDFDDGGKWGRQLGADGLETVFGGFGHLFK